MTLNDTFDFAKDALREHQDAFVGSFGVHKVLVPGGTVLYKLTQYDLVYKGQITPWWNYFHPTRVRLENGQAFFEGGWTEAQVRAQRLGATAEEYGRVRSAVTHEWNTMTNFLKARLNRDVYGWFGQNMGMPTHQNSRKVLFIGGAYQLYIPNLATGMMTEMH